MPTVAKYVEIARDYLRDFPRFFNVRLTGHGLDQAYEIPHENIKPDSLVVTVGGLAVTDYTLYSRDGFLRFTAPPADESQIYIEGEYFEWINDEDFARYVGYALDQFETSEGADNLFDNIETNPDLINVIALTGMLEALWALWTETGREIDVSSPEVSVPLRQRHSQLTNMIQIWQSELDERMQMLNVGRSKLEVLHARRVSRTTGRLVPIFQEQEIEDRGRPKRVRIPSNDLRVTGEP